MLVSTALNVGKRGVRGMHRTSWKGPYRFFMNGGLRAEHIGMCSARAARAFCEFGLKAGEVEAMREAIAVGRQPRVVMLEDV